MAAKPAAVDAIRAALDAAAVHAELLIEAGDPIHWIKEVGFLNDLVIISRSFAHDPAGGSPPSVTTRALIEQVNRPILLLGPSVAEWFPQRALVVHDTRRQSNEAIFIAAYLAERWGVALSVLPLGNSDDAEAAVEETKRYLAVHEVTAAFMEPIRPDSRAAEHVVQSGIAGDFDLLLLTGPERGRKGNKHNNPTDMVWKVLEHWPNSTLIAA